MLDDKDPSDPNFTVEHCRDPDRLREALAVALDRVHRLSGRSDLPADARSELRRVAWMISAHGIRPTPQPIGRKDTFASNQPDET